VAVCLFQGLNEPRTSGMKSTGRDVSYYYLFFLFYLFEFKQLKGEDKMSLSIANVLKSGFLNSTIFKTEQLFVQVKNKPHIAFNPKPH
jgi:hypothetical protein